MRGHGTWERRHGHGTWTGDMGHQGTQDMGEETQTWDMGQGTGTQGYEGTWHRDGGHRTRTQKMGQVHERTWDRRHGHGPGPGDMWGQGDMGTQTRDMRGHRTGDMGTGDTDTGHEEQGTWDMDRGHEGTWAPRYCQLCAPARGGGTRLGPAPSPVPAPRPQTQRPLRPLSPPRLCPRPLVPSCPVSLSPVPGPITPTVHRVPGVIVPSTVSPCPQAQYCPIPVP